MKRIEHRSAIALLLAAALALSMGFFVVRLALCGGDWASYSANQHIYQNGVLKSSTLTDRNGVILAQTENGAWRYADDPAVRLSSVHAVGDYRGYISGAISAFADELAGYSFVYGTPGGGTEVALSLDTRLQTAAWDALAGRRGAVLVMNYETGEILTMVSSPSYDPNGEADTSIDGLFINRCTLGTFTPGSVFKLVTHRRGGKPPRSHRTDVHLQSVSRSPRRDGRMYGLARPADDRAGARKFLQLRVWGACA